MATKIITRVTCDECGAEGSNPNITFVYQGKAYEVDLCERHYNELERSLNPVIEVARRGRLSLSQSATPVRRRRSSGAAARGLDPAEVRRWANKNNITIPDRGRIPAPVLEKFQESRAS